MARYIAPDRDSHKSNSSGRYIGPDRGGKATTPQQAANYLKNKNQQGFVGKFFSEAKDAMVNAPGGLYTIGKAIGHDSAKLAAKTPGLSSPSAKRLGKGSWETPPIGKSIAKG